MFCLLHSNIHRQLHAAPYWPCIPRSIPSSHFISLYTWRDKGLGGSVLQFHNESSVYSRLSIVIKYDCGKLRTAHKNYYSVLRKHNGAWFGTLVTARVEVPGTYLLGRLVVEVTWCHDVSTAKLLVIFIEMRMWQWRIPALWRRKAGGGTRTESATVRSNRVLTRLGCESRLLGHSTHAGWHICAGILCKTNGCPADEMCTTIHVLYRDTEPLWTLYFYATEKTIFLPILCIRVPCLQRNPPFCSLVHRKRLACAWFSIAVFTLASVPVNRLYLLMLNSYDDYFYWILTTFAYILLWRSRIYWPM